MKAIQGQAQRTLSDPKPQYHTMLLKSSVSRMEKAGRKPFPWDPVFFVVVVVVFKLLVYQVVFCGLCPVGNK